MTKAIITLLIGLISLSTQAQKIIEKNIPYKNQYIDIDVKFASEIVLKTWDKPSVYFKADIRTKGGKYLDSYALSISENSNSITITSKSKAIFKKFQEEWYESRSGNEKHYYNTSDMYSFNYVVFVPEKAKFKVSSINGDLASEYIEGEFEADLINGDIEIASYSGKLDLSTINGEIDLKIVDSQLEAETIHGDIYADEKFKFTVTDHHVGQKISGATGASSNRIKLNTINGNMYLRY